MSDGNIVDKNEIIVTIVATIISGSVSNLFQSLIDNIISPFINIDLNGDGVPDQHNLKNFTINVGGKEIKIGKFIFNLIEFIIVLVIIHLINKTLKD